MPVNITEEFVRQLMAQIDFLTKQNSALTATVDSMNQTIIEMNQTIKELKDEVSYYHRHKFDMEYDAIIKTAYEGNPLPENHAKKRGRKKKAK